MAEKMDEEIRKWVRSEFVYFESLGEMLESTEYRVSKNGPLPASQFANVYGMRCGMAKASGKGNSLQIQAMGDLVTRLKLHGDSPCMSWILDTGDHEFILFGVVNAEPVGILFLIEINCAVRGFVVHATYVLTANPQTILVHNAKITLHRIHGNTGQVS